MAGVGVEQKSSAFNQNVDHIGWIHERLNNEIINYEDIYDLLIGVQIFEILSQSSFIRYLQADLSSCSVRLTRFVYVSLAVANDIRVSINIVA